MTFLKQENSHFLLYVKATPNSAKNKISGKFIDEKNQEYLKINLAAVPEDGKANEELVKFLSKLLKIPKSQIAVIRGETSRMKVIKFEEAISAEAFKDAVANQVFLRKF